VRTNEELRIQTEDLRKMDSYPIKKNSDYMKCLQKKCPFNNDGTCEEPVNFKIDGTYECYLRAKERWVKSLEVRR